MHTYLKAERRLEWWLARFTVVYGVWLLLLPGSMDGPGYAVLTRWAEAECWGAAALIVGAAHWTALCINGMAAWTPYARAGAAALNAIFFAVIGTGFLLADANSVSVSVYFFGFAWAAFIAFANAWRDSVRVYANQARRHG